MCCFMFAIQPTNMKQPDTVSLNLGFKSTLIQNPWNCLLRELKLKKLHFFISFIYNKKHEEAAALQSSFYSYFQELRSKLE